VPKLNLDPDHISDFLNESGNNIYSIYTASKKKVEELEDLLISHEISRQDYVHQLQAEARHIDDYAQKQNDPGIEIALRMQSAFIYYSLANQRRYFNAEDIRQFVIKALKRYKDISTFLSSHPEVNKGDLINIVAIVRYLYLGQKNGLGLMNPPQEVFTDNDDPIVSYAQNLSFFQTGISILDRLGDEDLKLFIKDSTASIKIIHHYDILAREWELFSKEDDSGKSAEISRNITKFRTRFMGTSIQEQFNALLESDKIKNVGFVVKFYTTLVWHGLYRPMDALKEIIKYSAYDKIKASDLFYYELSAYRFLLIRRCESISDCSKDLTQRHHDPAKIQHLKNYHRENMIQLLFRIKRSESAYKFHKARLHFEQMAQTRFKIDHFSDTIRKENNYYTAKSMPIEIH
jgi:hypothetical protein